MLLSLSGTAAPSPSKFSGTSIFPDMVNSLNGLLAESQTGVDKVIPEAPGF